VKGKEKEELKVVARQIVDVAGRVIAEVKLVKREYERGEKGLAYDGIEVTDKNFAKLMELIEVHNGWKDAVR